MEAQPTVVLLGRLQRRKEVFPQRKGKFAGRLAGTKIPDDTANPPFCQQAHPLGFKISQAPHLFGIARHRFVVPLPGINIGAPLRVFGIGQQPLLNVDTRCTDRISQLAQFDLIDIVRQPRYYLRLRRNLFDLRQEGDYIDFVTLDAEKVEPLVAETVVFIETIRVLLL